MKLWIALATGVALTTASLTPRLEAQQTTVSCITSEGKTTCDWAAFKKVLDSAHIVRAEYAGQERSTGAQLKDLIKKLDKQLAKDSDAADLTFTVQPAPSIGIDMGAANQEILEVRVYAGNDSSARLAWVERYVGLKDRPWPANVGLALQQFLHRVQGKQ